MPGPHSDIKTVLTGIGIPILMIRRWRGRVIFMIERHLDIGIAYNITHELQRRHMTVNASQITDYGTIALQFVQANIKENIKLPHNRPFVREFNDRHGGIYAQRDSYAVSVPMPRRLMRALSSQRRMCRGNHYVIINSHKNTFGFVRLWFVLITSFQLLWRMKYDIH